MKKIELNVVLAVLLVVIIGMPSGSWLIVKGVLDVPTYEQGLAEGIEIGKNFYPHDTLVRTIDEICYKYLGWDEAGQRHILRNRETLMIEFVTTTPLTAVRDCGEGKL